MTRTGVERVAALVQLQVQRHHVQDADQPAQQEPGPLPTFKGYFPQEDK